MTAILVRTTNGSGSLAATSTLSMVAPASGNTVIVGFELPIANGTPTSVVDSAGNTYTADFSRTTATSHASTGAYIYRRSNVTNAPTSISVTMSSGTFAVPMTIQEVSGLDPTPLSQQFYSAPNGGSAVTMHTLSITTTTANEFVFAMATTGNARSISSVTGGFVSWAAGAINKGGASNSDIGAAGVKTSDFTFSATTPASFCVVAYKTLVIIPTMTINDVTVSNIDGTATFTITLSQTAGSDVTVNYSSSNVTATAGTDYTAVSGTATILAGQLSTTVTVPILE